MNTDYARSVAQRHGCHWFDASSMKFFNSRVCESTWVTIRNTPSETVCRFISSERFEDDPRRYTVHEFRWHTKWAAGPSDGSVSVETVGEFQQYATARTALAHIHDGEVTD